MAKNKWFKFLILYLGAMALALSQIKIAPIQESMGLPLKDFSWLASVFTYSAVILGLPGGALISKYGAKKVGIVVMACLVLGNLLGAFSVSSESVTNYQMLLFSRVVEGISFALINLLAMVFIGEWFKDSSPGMAIGIFGTFSAAASIFGYNLYLPIFNNFGLRSVWIFTAILAGVALLGFMFLLDDAREQSSGTEEKGSYREVLLQKNTWLLSIAMFTMTFVLYSFLNYYLRILTEVFSVSVESANASTGIFGLVGVPFGFVAGFMVDKLKLKPAILGVLTGILMAFGSFMVIIIPSSMILVQVSILSAGISMFSSSISISVPKTVPRTALIGQTFAVVYLFYYIGTSVGPTAVAAIVEKFGDWKAACVAMACVVLAGAACMFILHLSTSKKQALKQETA